MMYKVFPIVLILVGIVVIIYSNHYSNQILDSISDKEQLLLSPLKICKGGGLLGMVKGDSDDGNGLLDRIKDDNSDDKRLLDVLEGGGSKLLICSIVEIAIQGLGERVSARLDHANEKLNDFVQLFRLAGIFGGVILILIGGSNLAVILRIDKMDGKTPLI